MFKDKKKMIFATTVSFLNNIKEFPTFCIFVSRSWGSDEKTPTEKATTGSTENSMNNTNTQNHENGENIKPSTSCDSIRPNNISSGTGSIDDEEEDMSEVTLDMDSLQKVSIPPSTYPSQNKMKRYADQSIPSHELTREGEEGYLIENGCH